MEGLAKKVEIRVIKAVENDTKDKLKGLEKDMRKDMDKLKRNMYRTEMDIKRVTQTTIPTVQEKLGDEIDNLTERIASLENRNKETDRLAERDGIDRKRRVVIQNLEERENENIRERVNNIIDYLNMKDVKIEAAERKTNSYNSKPGVVLVSFYTYDDKEKVMKKKKDLRGSSRYQNVYIENDVPQHQRKLKNNLRTIVKTLGGEKLRFNGSRVIRSEQYGRSQETERGDMRNLVHQYDSYETRRPSSNRETRENYNNDRGSYRYHTHRDRSGSWGNKAHKHSSANRRH